MKKKQELKLEIYNPKGEVVKQILLKPTNQLYLIWKKNKLIDIELIIK